MLITPTSERALPGDGQPTQPAAGEEAPSKTTEVDGVAAAVARATTQTTTAPESPDKALNAQGLVLLKANDAVSFNGLRLKNPGWVPDLSGANLHGANLHGANLHGANLSGADLPGADLSGADLSEANLYGANLYGANLSEANLYGADLHGADLSEADLFETDFYRARLSGTDLSEANLFRARLSGTDLSEANLFRARLSGADLSRANLENVKGLTPQQLVETTFAGITIDEGQKGLVDEALRIIKNSVK